MYRIIGADGKEYGPVDAEQIKSWLTEGRVNLRSNVLAEGATQWRPLSEFPELAGSAGMQPMSSPASPSRPVNATTAAQQVSGPATGLIVTAILGFVVQAGSILINVFGFSMGFLDTSPDAVALNFLSGTMGLFLNVVGLAIGAVILIGAQKMKKLESHGWAMASSILALAPCISPCCVVGLPVGIWSLVVILKPEVKGAFRG
jgi:hypothetical protein